MMSLNTRYRLGSVTVNKMLSIVRMNIYDYEYMPPLRLFVLLNTLA